MKLIVIIFKFDYLILWSGVIKIFFIMIFGEMILVNYFSLRMLD